MMLWFRGCLRYLRPVGMGLLILAALLLWGYGQDSDQEGPIGYSVTLNNTVRIDITPHTFVTHATQRADLLQQYYDIGIFDINVYAITDYEVSISKVTKLKQQAPGGTTTAFEMIRDELMEIRTLSLEGDDGSDNPYPAPGAYFDTWTKIPDTVTGFKPLFYGGNTEGGAVNYHRAREALRFDLAAFRDNASGNVYTFTITLLLTEK